MPFFYGWLLVAIGFVTMVVGVNARTSFSLLFPPILDEFGWDRVVTAGIFSFGFLVSALVTPFVGRLMDRRGPALVVELGVVAMAAGLLLAPLAREAWQLYLTLGAFVGGCINCLAYTGQSLYLTNWFVHRRGLEARTDAAAPLPSGASKVNAGRQDNRRSSGRPGRCA